MGDVHPASVRGRAVQMDARRRRQGRAARGSRAEELEGATLDRHPGAGGVMLAATGAPFAPILKEHACTVGIICSLSHARVSKDDGRLMLRDASHAAMLVD